MGVAVSDAVVAWPNGHIGPFQASDGSLWIFATPNSATSISSYKSTDGGTNWSKIATQAITITAQGMDCEQSGDTVYIAVSQIGQAARLYSYNINGGTSFTTLSTAGPVTRAGASASYAPISLVLRSTGTLILAHSGTVATNTMTDYRRIYYSEFTIGTGWGAQIAINWGTGNTTAANEDVKTAEADASGRVHFVYARSNASTIPCIRTLSAANAFSAEQSWTAVVNWGTRIYNVGRAIMMGTTVVIPFTDSTNTRYMYFTTADTVASASVTYVTVEAVQPTNTAGLGIRISYDTARSILWCAFVQSTNGDVYDEIPSSAPHTWANASTARETATGAFLSANYITGAMGYVYVDGALSTTIKFGKVDAPPPPAAYDQDAYRFRNDDGSETTATWKAAVNTGVTLPVTAKFRLRVGVEETLGVDPSAFAFSLQWRIDSGPWQDIAGAGVTGASVIRAVASANVTEGAATTQQITSGTFSAGAFEETTAAGASVDMAASGKTELEWSLEFFEETLDPFSNGSVIEFRVVRPSATPLDSYTVTPTLTIGAGGVLTPITLAGSATLAGALVKFRKSPVLVSASLTPTMAANSKLLLKRTLDAAITLTPIVTPRAIRPRTLAGALTLAPVLNRKQLQTEAVTVPVTVSVAAKRSLAISQPLTVALTGVMAVVRLFKRTSAAGITLAPAIDRKQTRFFTLANAPTLTAVLTRLALFRRSQDAGITLTPTIARQQLRRFSLAGAITFTPTLVRALVQRITLAGAITFTSVMTRLALFRRSQDVTVTLAPVISRQPLWKRTLDGTVTFALAVIRKITNTQPGAITFTPLLTRVRFTSVVLPQSITLTGLLSKIYKRLNDVSITLTPSVKRNFFVTAALTVTVTPVMAAIRMFKRAAAAGVTITPTMTPVKSRFFTLPLTATLTGVLSRIALYRRNQDAALVISPTLTRLPLWKRALDAGVTLSATIARQAMRFQSAPAGISFAPVMLSVKSRFTTLPVVATLAGVLSRIAFYRRSEDASLILSANAQRRITRALPLTLTITPVLTLLRLARRSLDVVVNFIGTVNAQRTQVTTPVTLSGVLSLPAALTRRLTHPQALDASAALTAALTRLSVAKRALVGAVSFTGTLARAAIRPRSFPAGITFTPTAVGVKSRFRTLAAALTLTGVLTRRPNKIMPNTVTLTPASNYKVTRLLPLGLTFTPTVVKGAIRSRAIAAAMTLTAALTKVNFIVTAVTLARTFVLNGTIAKVRLAKVSLNGNVVFNSILNRLVPTRFAATLSIAASFGRRMERSLAGSLLIVVTSSAYKAQREILMVQVMRIRIVFTTRRRRFKNWLRSARFQKPTIRKVR